jgi:hypothetical protein
MEEQTMALRDIGRDHILAAIEEARSLGRDDFLDQYGFGPARSYFVVHEGRAFDSKAIVGVAHQYVSADAGPLAAPEFSGGDATVAALLRRHNFDVASLQSERPTWLFQADPSRFDLDAMLATQQDETLVWSVSRYKSEIRAGHRMLLWEAGPTGGLRAVCTILTDVYELDEPDEFGAVKVDFAIARLISPPVEREVLLAHPVLSKLDVLQMPRATNFRVSTEQWQALGGLLDSSGMEGSDDRSEGVRLAEEAAEILAGKPPPPTQGFRPNAQQRRAIEMRAMDVGRDFLTNLGWSVHDVSRDPAHPFDLHATRSDGSELEVEVKGTTSAGTKVLLTRNEVASASSLDKAALAVVANIRLDTGAQPPNAAGGDLSLHHPWTPAPESLQAISYAYEVPPQP